MYPQTHPLFHYFLNFDFFFKLGIYVSIEISSRSIYIKKKLNGNNSQ